MVTQTTARGFDGLSTEPREAVLALSADALSVSWGDRADIFRFADLRLGESSATAPCPVELPGGVTIWLDDARFVSALRRARGGSGWVERAVASGTAALLALLLTVLLVVWLERQGVGLAARAALPLVPHSADQRIGETAWQYLDGQELQPTRHLDRCLDLAKRFDSALKVAGDERFIPMIQCRRRGDEVNAFALPNGQIVLLDGLLERLTDDEVLGVLGHELSHVRRRHAMEALMRQMGLLAMASVVFGDFSTVAAGVFATTTGLRYSRDAERQADQDAVDFLRASGNDPAVMTQVWRKFAALQAEAGVSVPLWLSSHPPPEERERAVQR